MPAPTSHPVSSNSSAANPKILESRGDYRSCHICLPGEEQRLPAVVVDGRYYSLFKVVKDHRNALEICARLAARGSQTVLTQTAKGDAIWVLEPEATPAKSQSCPVLMKQDAIPPTCRILESRSDYRFCHIQVPDLDKNLAAILVDGTYYGLLKVVETRQKALELAVRLGRKGDRTAITKLAQGEAVWVMEAEAQPAR